MDSFAARCGSWLRFGNSTEPPPTFEHYKIAADTGRPNAEYHISVFYHDGIRGKNYRTAITWLRKAVIHGDNTAVYRLGQCPLHGRGVARNEEKGFTLELAAAKKRVVEARYSVGVCYERGQGVRASLKKAFQWYLRAPRLGHKGAAFSLAHFYEQGPGTARNERKAPILGRARC